MSENNLQKNNKNKLVGGCIVAVVGLLLSVAVAGLEGLLNVESTEKLYYVLCDTFCLPGLLILGIFGMIWIGSTGTLDIFSFGFKNLLYLFTPFKKRTSNYYEYKQEQAARRGELPMYILWVGLGFLAVGLIFLALFYSVYVPEITT